jgi:hypothetical protein
MRRAALSAIAFTVLLSGCVRHYAIPTNVPKATLNVSTTMHGVRVQVYDDDKCTHSPHGNRLAYFFWGTADPLTGVDREIPANREFVHTYAFSSYYYVGMTSCNVTVAFKPVEGARYKSSFSPRANQCVVTVSRLVTTESGERLVPEETVRQIKPACVNNLTD